MNFDFTCRCGSVKNIDIPDGYTCFSYGYICHCGVEAKIEKAQDGSYNLTTITTRPTEESKKLYAIYADIINENAGDVYTNIINNIRAGLNNKAVKWLNDIHDVKHRLDLAVENEDYEQAAILRDQLAELQKIHGV